MPPKQKIVRHERGLRRREVLGGRGEAAGPRQLGQPQEETHIGKDEGGLQQQEPHGQQQQVQNGTSFNCLKTQSLHH